jgi:hypothetical protein
MSSGDIGDFIVSNIQDPVSRTNGVGDFQTFGRQGKIRFGQRLRQPVQKRPAAQILLFVTSSTHANNSPDIVMTASSNAVRSLEHQPHLNEVPRNSASLAPGNFGL